MTEQERKDFICQLIESVSGDIYRRAEHMPDDWDGIELRQYIAEKFAEASYPWKRQPLSRRRAYKNELITRPL